VLDQALQELIIKCGSVSGQPHSGLRCLLGSLGESDDLGG
jgi:hypothetical protein